VPNEGTYTVNADGTITFNPLPTFRGTASPIKYVVADTTGQVAGATITPTVAAPGVPAVNPESKAVIPGGTATFTTLTGANGLGSSGVGFNTSLTCLYTPSTTNCDADGVIVIAGEGTYTLNQSTGVVTFVADANATQGTKTPITYRITDITGQTATSTLTPVVPAPPVAVNDTSSGAYDTNQTISILGNDTVTSPATLVPTSVKLCATTSTLNANCNLTTLTVPNEGTYTVNANGTVTFDPLPTFVGPASPIKYVVADTTGQVTGAMITPTVSMPAVPVATSESKAVIPGGTATFTTLTGANGLATSGVGFNTSVTCLVTPSTTSCDPDGVVTIAGEGTYTLNTSTGVVTFVADVNATQGTKTALSYKVTDIFGQTSTSTLTPVIPAPPIGVNDTSSGAYDTNQTISILGNDTVTSPATLVPTSVKLCATTSTLNANCNLTTLTVPNEGTYTVNANGTITFDPLPTFVGTASPIKYVVADSTGQLANATITPTVSMPAVPVATPQTKAVIPGGAIAFTTLTGANGLATSGVGFNTSVTCLITPSTTSCDPDGIVTIAGEGTYTLNTSTGVITFVADVNATQGTKTALTYKVTDVFGQTATSTITPVIPAPPVAVNDTSTGAFDTNQTISPLTNDSATTPATLVASSVKLCATTSTVNASCTLTTLTVSNEGTYTVNANGTITFDPLPTFVGTASPVKYVVADTTGQLASATITPAVSMPAAPVATPQTKIVIPGGSTAFTTVTGTGGLATTPVSFNTSATCLYTPSTASCDADGIVTIAGEGTFTLDTSTGVVTFVADINATVGTKTPLAYKVTDVFGQTATSTLTPIIPAPPAALNDTNTDAYDVTQVISPLTNDSAVAPATLVASSVKLCATAATADASCTLTTLTVSNEGTYTVNANGTVSFDPLPTFIGTAAPVKYTVADINGRVASATITPTVLMPPPPVATPDLRAVAPASTVSFQPITGSGALAAGAVGGAALDPTTLCIVDPSTMICGTTPVTIAGEGTYTLNVATGMVSYTSLATTPIGRRTSITYRITDIFGQTVTSTLTPVIPPMPTIRDDTSSGPWNTAQTLVPITNDAAGAGTSLVPSTAKLCLNNTTAASACTSTTLTIPGEGIYTVLANGNVKFVPLPTFFGTATSIKYSVSDGAGQLSMANIVVVVDAPTSKPSAKPQTLEVNRGESVQFTTITGKQGLATSKLGLNKSVTCLIDPTTVVAAMDTNVCDADGEVTVPNLGKFKLNKTTGVVTFTASRNAKAGRGLSVTYQVTDSAGQAVQAKLTPIIPTRPQLPSTGARTTEPLLLAALMMISIGVATNRSKRLVSRHA
jgi:CshA-type fibril repeat protein